MSIWVILIEMIVFAAIFTAIILIFRRNILNHMSGSM